MKLFLALTMIALGTPAHATGIYPGTPAQTSVREINVRKLEIGHNPPQSVVLSDLNNGGIVVGSSLNRATVWDGSGQINLQLPTAQSRFNSVNDGGDVVGTVTGRAILVKAGEVIDLAPTLGNPSYSEAQMINSVGQIVGQFYQDNSNSDMQLFSIEGSEVLNLSRLLPSTLKYFKINGLNNRGEVLISAYNSAVADSEDYIVYKGKVTQVKVHFGASRFVIRSLNNDGTLTGGLYLTGNSPHIARPVVMQPDGELVKEYEIPQNSKAAEIRFRNDNGFAAGLVEEVTGGLVGAVWGPDGKLVQLHNSGKVDALIKINNLGSILGGICKSNCDDFGSRSWEQAILD